MKKRVALVILLLFALLGSSINIANAVKAEIVSDVKGLSDYVRTSENFIRGSTLKVYTEMDDVNYDGFAFVDFTFIIKDPEGHVVSMDRTSVRHRDYVDDVYVEYTRKIPSWWLYGEYKLDIFAYDRLNKTRIIELEREAKLTAPEKLDNFGDLETFFESGSNAGDLGVMKSLEDSIREKTSITFFVRKKEEIKPAKPKVEKKPIFNVTNVGIDKFEVKPGETVSVSVTVRNEGVAGEKKISLVINGDKEAERLVTLGHMESKTLTFHVKKDLPGTYKVTIPGTDIVKLFFVESGNSTASASVESGAGSQHSGGKLPVYALGFGIIVSIAILLIVLLFIRSD